MKIVTCFCSNIRSRLCLQEKKQFQLPSVQGDYHKYNHQVTAFQSCRTIKCHGKMLTGPSNDRTVPHCHMHCFISFNTP